MAHQLKPGRALLVTSVFDCGHGVGADTWDSQLTKWSSRLQTVLACSSNYSSGSLADTMQHCCGTVLGANALCPSCRPSVMFPHNDRVDLITIGAFGATSLGLIYPTSAGPATRWSPFLLPPNPSATVMETAISTLLNNVTGSQTSDLTVSRTPPGANGVCCCESHPPITHVDVLAGTH